MKTTAQTISEATREHLLTRNGLLFGQCITAVGWVGGTIPQLTENDGIVELSMADVAGPGIAVGAALVGRRPIYVIRYQGFMWYNAAPLLNYAAKSKAMWNVPCPILVRSIAMEGAIGPVASHAHHGMVMHMPGMPVCAPMTPGEWRAAWQWFLEHDEPLYLSEHRRGFPLTEEMTPVISNDARITILAISAARLNAREAQVTLSATGVSVDIFDIVWLKPFALPDAARQSLLRTGLGLVVDSDYGISGPARSLAYELMHELRIPVHALGVADRTAGFAPHLDNGTPTAAQIEEAVRAALA